MNAIEHVVYRDDRARGAVYTGAGVGIGLAGGAIMRSPAVAVASVTAGRELRAAALRAM